MFQDQSPSWDHYWEEGLPNDCQESFGDVVQCLDLYVKVAAYCVFEDYQGRDSRYGGVGVTSADQAAESQKVTIKGTRKRKINSPYHYSREKPAEIPDG